MSRLGAIGCEARKEENLRGTAKGCWKKTQNKSTLRYVGRRPSKQLMLLKAKVFEREWIRKVLTNWSFF